MSQLVQLIPLLVIGADARSVMLNACAGAKCVLLNACADANSAAQVTTPTQQALTSKPGGGRAAAGGGGAASPEPDNAVTEMLENTLWNRQLGVMSEEIVAALVCQIFEGKHALGHSAFFPLGI